MRWSGLRARVEETFADAVRGHVAVHSTRYGNCTCGHGWLTIDGAVVANMDTRAQWDHWHDSPANQFGHIIIEDAARHPGNTVETGEFSRDDLYAACWDYIHSNAHAALRSENPLVQGLAVLNRRLGKRSLATLDPATLHPFPRALLAYRTRREGWQLLIRSEAGTATATRKADPQLEELTSEEARRVFDELAHELLGMTGDEFLRRYDAGEFDGDERFGVLHLINLQSFGR